jgi:hypothetical protein
MENMMKKTNSVNPFLTVMFFKMAWATWIMFTNRLFAIKKRAGRVEQNRLELISKGFFEEAEKAEDTEPPVPAEVLIEIFIYTEDITYLPFEEGDDENGSVINAS